MEKFEAEAKAAALVNELGDGWEPKVWENLGWHYAATNGTIKIHSARDGYTAFIGADRSAGGKWAHHGDTPMEALENTIEKATSPYWMSLVMSVIKAKDLVEKHKREGK